MEKQISELKELNENEIAEMIENWKYIDDKKQ